VLERHASTPLINYQPSVVTPGTVAGRATASIFTSWENISTAAQFKNYDYRATLVVANDNISDVFGVRSQFSD
jgi:hypothetical protein